MKKLSLLLVVLAAFLVLAVSAEAGSYTKQNHSLYLDGKVLVRFDQLLLGWTRDQKEIDRIRFKMTCLKGKAVLEALLSVGVDAHVTDDMYTDEQAYTYETLTLLDSDADVLWTLDDMDGDYVQAFLAWEAARDAEESLESMRAQWLAEARA